VPGCGGQSPGRLGHDLAGVDRSGASHQPLARCVGFGDDSFTISRKIERVYRIVFSNFTDLFGNCAGLLKAGCVCVNSIGY
jgi:hypothetical protein